jgi:hypothetical protein
VTSQWQYQIRIYLNDEFAEVARRNPDDRVIAPLTDIPTKHHATMKCQFDAFADYVAEAEKHGPENYPPVASAGSRLGAGRKLLRGGSTSRAGGRGRSLFLATYGSGPSSLALGACR